MIDETLFRLSRELIAASDKLDSADFRERQAAFVALEEKQKAIAEERLTLAISLEADETAVVLAQEAIQAYITGSATPAAPEPEIAVSDDPEPVIEHAPGWAGIFAEQQTDEFSSSRANGAYTEE
jgi:hypothetical protein